MALQFRSVLPYRNILLLSIALQMTSSVKTSRRKVKKKKKITKKMYINKKLFYRCRLTVDAAVLTLRFLSSATTIFNHNRHNPSDYNNLLDIPVYTRWRCVRVFKSTDRLLLLSYYYYYFLRLQYHAQRMFDKNIINSKNACHQHVT